MQQDNAAKLEQMRQTVDEKLQATLEQVLDLLAAGTVVPGAEQRPEVRLVRPGGGRVGQAALALGPIEEIEELVFLLRDVEGLSVKETAEALGLSEANTKVRLLRARLQLRELLTRKLGDPARRLAPGHHHDHGP